MKLSEIVNAAPGIQKLIVQDIPIKTAYEVMKLTERVNPLLRFFGDEELKALGDENKMKELRDMEVRDLDGVEKIPLILSENILLSPSDVKHLTPLIDFQEAKA